MSFPQLRSSRFLRGLCRPCGLNLGLILALVGSGVHLGVPPAAAGPIVAEPRGDGYIVRFEPADLLLEPTPDGTRVTYRDGMAPAEMAGAPGLPVLPLVLEIPIDRTATGIEMIAVEDEIAARGIDVAPAGMPAHGEMTFPVPARRADLYASTTPIPAAHARIVHEGFARAHRLVTVELAPLHWTPVTGELRLATAIHFRLRLAPAADRPLVQRRFVAEAEDRFASTLDRALGRPPRPAARRPPPAGATPFAPTFPPSTDGSPVEYVILTNEAMRPEFEDLADWKTRKGHAAAVVTIEWVADNYPNGADRAEKLRFFLQDAYQNWGTLWLLVGGDTEVIPARYATSILFSTPDDPEYIPTDLYYACLDGNWNADKDDRLGEAIEDNADFLPELFVGRAPVANVQEAANFVAKELAHERTPPVTDLYPSSIVFLAEHLGFMDGAEIAEEAFTRVHPWMRRVRMYENSAAYPGSVPLNREAAIDSVNSGFGWVHHLGHGFRNTMSVGDGTITNPDADGFVNGNRQSFIFAINCSSASIDFNSVGERWLKNPNGGAVGYVGTTRLAYPQVSRRYQNEFYDLAFADSIGTAGECLFMSRLPFVGGSQTENPDRYTQFALILLGDPELPLWTNRPHPLTAEHAANLILNTGSFAVTVRSGGSPVDSANVTLWAPGQDYQSAFTEPNGMVTVPFDPETTGTFVLTTTRRNYIPFETTVPVVSSSAPFLYIHSLAIDDDNEGGSAGNDDGMVNAGETVMLSLALRNSGQSTATSVAADLTVESGAQHIQILSGATSYSNIPPGEVSSGSPHQVQILPSAPPGFLPRFRINATSGPDTWSDIFVLPVHAVVIEQYGHAWDDAPPGGNGNGVIEPGEAVGYTIELRNDGTGQAVDVEGRIRVLNAATGNPDPEVMVTDDFHSFGTMNVGERRTGSFAFALTLQAVPSALRLELTASDVYDTLAVQGSDFQVPGAVDSLRAIQSDDSIRILWAQAPAVTDLRGYDIYRATAPEGPFLRANDHTVIGITFFEDFPLPPLSRFHYKVAARDSSFNLGILSDVVSASTNPPLASGWPIETGQSTTTGVQVIDFDDDGQNELVTGSDYIYAWHGNGLEVRDGDNDPRTSGPFTLAGYDNQNGFRSDAAIADIDFDGALDIVIVGWGSNQGFLHVLSPQGAPRPGWPRSLGGSFNWGTAAVGQLDNDYLYEIVVQQGQSGVVYAFNHNGTELRDGDQNPSTIGPFFETGASFAYASPALGDFDLDGKDEIVVSSNSLPGNVYLLDGNGTVMPGWPVATGGQVTASAAVADLDGTLPPEIVVAAEDDSVYVFRANGTRYPGWPRHAKVLSSNGRTASPVVVDLNLDSVLDILYPANDGRFHAWRRDGTTLPGWSNVLFALDAINSEVTQCTPTVGDVDGDGQLEVLVGAENGKLYGFNHDGTELAGFPIALEGEVRASATIADVDLDGMVEISMAGWDQVVYVWDMPGAFVPERMPWPTFRHDLRNTGNIATSAVIGLDDVGGPSLPTAFRLWPVRPNPFNPATEISLDVPAGGERDRITLQIYDVYGRLARLLLESPLAPGRHTFTWDGMDGAGRHLPSGVYFLRAASPEWDAVHKLTLIK